MTLYEFYIDLPKFKKCFSKNPNFGRTKAFLRSINILYAFYSKFDKFLWFWKKIMYFSKKNNFLKKPYPSV